jgi:serine/threonine protein kinase
MITLPQRLSERYELGELLGFGGMAEVYLAHDLRLHRNVAVKVLRANLARDPDCYLWFRREGRTRRRRIIPPSSRCTTPG